MIAGLLPRGGGPLRHRSRSETRDPGGTLQQLVQHIPLTRREQPLQHATQPARRVVATSRASVLTPGSRTFRSRSHAIPSVKIALGPSPDVHERAATQSTNSVSTSVNSFSP